MRNKTWHGQQSKFAMVNKLNFPWSKKVLQIFHGNINFEFPMAKTIGICSFHQFSILPNLSTKTKASIGHGRIAMVSSIHTAKIKREHNLLSDHL